MVSAAGPSFGVKSARQRIESFSILNAIPHALLYAVFSYAAPCELSRYILCSRNFRRIGMELRLWQALATRYQIFLPGAESSAPASTVTRMSQSELATAMQRTMGIAKSVWMLRRPENSFFHLLHLHVNWIACLQNVNHPEPLFRWQAEIAGLPELPPFDRQTLAAAAASSITWDTERQCRKVTILDHAVNACCNIARGVFLEGSPQFSRLYSHFLPLSHFNERYGSSELSRGVAGELLSAPQEPIEISFCADLDHRSRFRAATRNRFEQAVATNMAVSLATLRVSIAARIRTMPQEPSAWLARSTALRIGLINTNLVTGCESQLCLRAGYPVPQDFLMTIVRHFAERRSPAVFGLIRLSLTKGAVPNGDFYAQLYEASKKKFPEDTKWAIEWCVNGILSAIATHFKDQIEPCLTERLETQEKLAALFATMEA